MSYTKKVLKNTVFNYINAFSNLILSFINRTIFIYVLGVDVLGINSLLLNIVGILSFAELGIGVILNANLYSPVADSNYSKIKAYMNIYSHLYNVVLFFVLLLGIALIPCLKFIVKDINNYDNIYIYYIIILIDTVLSYFIAYEVGLIIAFQRNYFNNLLNTIILLIKNILQIIVLFVFKSYFFYLLISIITAVIKKIIQHIYYVNQFPFIYDEDLNYSISNDEKKILIKNLKAGFFGRLASISILSTDNIINSSFVGITSVGLVSSYYSLKVYIGHFLDPIFKESVPTIGEYINYNNIGLQKKLLKKMLFISFYMYSIASIAFLCLSNSFITLWIGNDKLVDDLTVLFIAIDLFLAGMRLSYFTYKEATAVFYDDYLHSIVEAIINIVLSIVGAIYMGLPGIYLGTVLTGLYESTIRIGVSYTRLTGENVKIYYFSLLKYVLCYFVALCPIYHCLKQYFYIDNWIKFVFSLIVIVMYCMFFYWLVFNKSDE